MSVPRSGMKRRGLPRFRFRNVRPAAVIEPSDFYWCYFMNNPFEYRILRGEPDGAIVWQYDYPDISLATPAYPRFASTTAGTFHPVWSAFTSDIPGSKSGFYLVDPDGVQVGPALLVDGNDAWGLDVVESASGDHYSVYFSWAAPPASAVGLAGWNGHTSLKWSRTFHSLVADNALYDVDYEGTSLALSPDGSLLVMLTVSSRMAGFSTATGETLWTLVVHPGDETYYWDAWLQVRFSPKGHLFLTVPDPVTTHGQVFRFDFPGGYSTAPEVAWSEEWGDAPRREVVGLAPASDGGVVVQGLGATGASSTPLVRRYSAAGNVVWATDMRTAGVVQTDPDGYAQLLLNGSHVLVPVEDEVFAPTPLALRRLSAATGEYEENGTEFPLFGGTDGWALTIGLERVR